MTDEEGQGLARFGYMEIGILAIWRSSTDFGGK